MPTPATGPSFLSTRRGRLTLALVCLAGFLDFIDTTIVNVALPSIREHLGFSEQSLQWVVSGYLLTYGGFLLLGGRAAEQQEAAVCQQIAADGPLQALHREVQVPPDRRERDVDDRRVDEVE